MEFHPPLIWKYYEKLQFYYTWARQIMATNPSVTAEEGQSLMVTFLAWVPETLSCVPFWSSKCKKEVARLEEVKRRTMEIIKGKDNGGNEEKNEGIFPWRKEASVVTSPNYSSTKRVARERIKVLIFTRIHMDNTRVTSCIRRGIILI